jgi:hypothetical protein
MRLELRVARTLTGYDCFAPMSVRALSEGHNMSTEEVRLTVINLAQIAIGAIYLLTGTLIPFLTDQPMLERLVWAAVLGLLPGLCLIAACVRTRYPTAPDRPGML